MQKLKQLLQVHKVAIFLAIVLSLVTAFPQVYFRIDHKDINTGIELLPDSPWSARAREVQDGHPNFGSIYYKDGKDNPYLFQPLGSMVVAYMGEAFSLGINNTILLSRFVLPFVAFLLLYAFVYLFWRDRLVALSSASVLLFADSILSFSGLLRMFHGLSPDSFLRLARPVNPAMVYILLFGFLVLFWQFYKKKDWRYGVGGAVLLGLNFYNYFYSWTFLYAFGGLIFLFLIFQKKWREAVGVSLVFVGGLVVAIPYAINMYRIMANPVYAEASLRTGVVMSHAPLFVGVLVVVALIMYWFGLPKENKEEYFFGLALAITPFITMNQQIITGKVLQAAHYHWFFHKPVAIILMLVVIFYLITKWNFVSYRKWLAGLIILFSVGTGIFVQVSSYFNDDRDGGLVAIERQKNGPVMSWLNENAKKESVVLANDELSHLTVIYTPLNVFYHRAAPYSLSATNKRLLEVIFTFYRLRGVGMKDTTNVFKDERGYISASVYGIHYRELSGSYESIPDKEIESITNQYLETLKTPKTEWIKNIFKKYEVEYVVWDKKNDPTWNLDQYKFLEKAADFDNGSLIIYRVI